MKKRFSKHGYAWQLFAVAAILMTGVTACRHDLGNYNYVNPNQVVIVDSLSSTDSFAIRQNDTLKIKVGLTQTTGNDSLSYRWYLIQAVSTALNPTQYLLDSLHQNLSARITVVPGNYKIVNKVTNAKNGVSFYKYFFLTVTTAPWGGEGWLVLQDQSTTLNGCDVSIILSKDGTTHEAVYHNLYALGNGRKLPIGTNGMYVMNYNKSLGIQKLTFAYPGGGVQVRNTDYTDSAYYYNWFFVPPASYNIQYNNCVNSGQYEVLVNNNQLYYQAVNPTSIKNPIFFGVPVQGSWTIAPYVIRYTGTGDYHTVVYDTAHQCFLGINLFSNALEPAMPDVPNAHYAAYSGSAASLLPTGTGFDLNHIGESLVYAENIQPISASSFSAYWDCFFRNTRGDSSFVMQLLSGIAVTNNNATGRYYLSPGKCPGINSATLFACPTYLVTPGIFYYVNSNKIYTCTLSSASGQGSSTAAVGYTFPSGTIIKAMHVYKSDYFTLPSNESKVLVVATDETANGGGNNVYFFNLSATGQISLADKYTGFDKIVDIKFKKALGV